MKGTRMDDSPGYLLGLSAALAATLILGLMVGACGGGGKGGPVRVEEGAETGDIDTGAETADDPIQPHIEKKITIDADTGIYDDKSHTESTIHTETHEFGEGAQKMMGRQWAIGLGLGLMMLGYIIKSPSSLHIRYILGGAGILILLGSVWALIFAW